MIRDFVYKSNMKTIILVGDGDDCKKIQQGMKNIYPVLNYMICDRKYVKSKEKRLINYTHIERYREAEFIISSSKFSIEIYKELIQHGIAENHIFTAMNLYNSAFVVNNSKLSYLYEKINYSREIRKLYAHLYNGWEVLSMDLLITERCTLNCRYCCALIPEYINPQNYNAEEIVKGLDNLLESGCYLGTLSLIGGEPLLNQNAICDILRHFKDNEHILTFQIITNGTIMPSDELLEIMRDVKRSYVIFSNYGDLSRKMEDASAKFQEYGIQVAIEEDDDISADANNLWLDYGTVENYCHSPESLQKMFDRCLDAKFCFSILKNKLYICNRIAHGVNLGLIPAEGYRTEFNLVDLEMYKGDLHLLREKCMVFLYGNRAPYGCMYCNRGAGLLGARAEQKKRTGVK